MGILDGKRILIAGVTMDSSIGFAVARIAQEQGATVLVSNFGRALGITKRIVGRLPEPAPVIELDVTDTEHLKRLPDLVREHVDGLDGLVHSIAFGNPETLLGGKFLEGPWDDVAQAVQVSAYSLASLSTACLPLMQDGGSVVGMTFDATVAWPAYDWMGVAKAGLESCSRYLARDLGPKGIRVNLISAGPSRPLPRRPSRGSRSSSRCGATARPSAGTRRTPSPRRVAWWPCSATSSRPPPVRSCTSTAATTPWVPDRQFLPHRGSDRFDSVRRMTSALVELRVLEGPNLYFPRAAMSFTLDMTALIDAPDEVALRFAGRIGLRSARPGGSGSGFRRRRAARAVGRLVRQIAGEAGTSRVAVRVRPTADVHQIVVAYPWRNRNRAQELGHAVASVLDGLGSPDGATPEAVEKLVSGAADAVREGGLGPGPTTLRPRVPVVAVAGTNGKTTTSRMVAHIPRAAGLHVGWSSTDGIYVDGGAGRGGQKPGPSGAGRVLAHEEVQLAVTETARGGILLKGIGLAYNDVSVFTNVSADHLGLHGINLLDQLAEVKGVVCRITRSDGWVVLNGDDPRVYATRSAIKAKPWVFSRDPDSPSVRETLTNGGRATTVIDSWLSVLTASSDPDRCWRRPTCR